MQTKVFCQKPRDRCAPSELFVSLEQKYGQKRLIHSVHTESGDLVSDPTETCKQTVSFYLSCTKVNLRLRLSGSSKLAQRSADELDKELICDKLQSVLSSKENRWSLEMDGLLLEFYKALWLVLGQDLLHDSLCDGQLPPSSHKAVLTILPKRVTSLT